MLFGVLIQTKVYLFIYFYGPRTESYSFAKTFYATSDGSISGYSYIVSVDVMEKKWWQIVGTASAGVRSWSCNNEKLHYNQMKEYINLVWLNTCTTSANCGKQQTRLNYLQKYISRCVFVSAICRRGAQQMCVEVVSYPQVLKWISHNFKVDR